MRISLVTYFIVSISGLIVVSCADGPGMTELLADTSMTVPDMSHDAPDPASDVDFDRPDLGGWEWVSLEGTTCGNGSRAGIGYREGQGEQVVFFLAGGGACWDGVSCYIVGSAVNIEVDYGAETFQSEIAPLQSSGILDEIFAGATAIYVPYCTADFHSGESVRSYDAFNPNRQIHHRGAANLDAIVSHVASMRPSVEEVFLIGVSAGGYGAVMNHHRFRGAFPGAAVHVLADGSPMIHPREGRWGMWKNAWNMQFPAGCATCEETYPGYAQQVMAAAPDSRFALLTYDADATVALYFAYGLDVGNAIRTHVADLFPSQPGGHAAAFVRDGTEHVMLTRYPSLRNNDGTILSDFIRSWALGEE